MQIFPFGRRKEAAPEKSPEEIQREALEAAQAKLALGRETQRIPAPEEMERFRRKLSPNNVGQLERMGRAARASDARIIEGEITFWTSRPDIFDREITNLD